MTDKRVGKGWLAMTLQFRMFATVDTGTAGDHATCLHPFPTWSAANPLRRQLPALLGEDMARVELALRVVTPARVLPRWALDRGGLPCKGRLVPTSRTKAEGKMR